MDKVKKAFENFFSTDSRSSGSKIKSSLFAILIGMVIGGIVIIFMGGNPFAAFIDMFTTPFKTLNFRSTVALSSIFIILGAGIGVSFKTGLFNIGAAGQFLAGGATAVMMSLTMPASMGNTAGMLIMLFVSVLAGAVLAAFAGMLKALFNVHEVVSTILLNWVTFYFVKWLFLKDAFASGTSGASKLIDSNFKWSLGLISSDHILIFLIAIVVIAILFVLFKFTNFGYRLRVNGLSNTAAEYAGINTKANTIASMAISGALAGLAGFIYYNTYQGQMPDLGSSLPNEGFEAITVTLLAFSSPIGALPAGIFYTAMKLGAPSAGIEVGVSGETISLTLSLIIFFAALADKFTKFSAIRTIKKYLYLKNEGYLEKRKGEYKENLESQKTLYAKKMSEQLSTDDKELISKIKASLQAIDYEDKDVVMKLRKVVDQLIKDKQMFVQTKNEILKALREVTLKQKQIISASTDDILEQDSQLRIMTNEIEKIAFDYSLNIIRDTKLNNKFINKSLKKSLVADLEAYYVEHEKELILQKANEMKNPTPPKSKVKNKVSKLKGGK